MKKSVVPALVLTLLTGCAGMPNPYKEGPHQNTAQFGTIGALAGAVAGAAINHDNRSQGAMLGGLVGAAGGALYGHHADSLENDLRSKLLGSGISVKRDGDKVSVVIPDQLAFAPGSGALTPQALRTLDDVADAMRRYPDAQLVVTSTNPGDAIANLDIARERAQIIAGHLSRSGVDARRMTMRAEGGRSAATLEWSGAELLQVNRAQYTQAYTPHGQQQYQQQPARQERPQTTYRPAPTPQYRAPYSAQYGASQTRQIAGNALLKAVAPAITSGPEAGLRALLSSAVRDSSRVATREINTEIRDYQTGYDR
jgi:outer membrane protein OmpA-like peptidoglycan-associated protein